MMARQTDRNRAGEPPAADRGLVLDAVTVGFGSLAAVDRVSLELAPGRVLAVLGPSGCGKSTLLRAIVGLEPLSAGQIRFAGADLSGVPTYRRGFGLVFQDGQLFDHLDVGANIAYGLRRRGRSRAQVRHRVAELLELVGLQQYAARKPATLSGGQRQRVAVARALAPVPRLLLMDEPLSALDRELRDRLAIDLRSILVRTATTAIVVTHDHDEASVLSDELAVLRSGRVVQHGVTAQVWRAPADAETARFLGYAAVLHGEAATALLRAAGQPAGTARTVAVRRSAVVVDPGGPLRAVVLEVVPSADQARCVLEATSVGRLPALAPATLLPAVGQTVGVRIDAAGITALPAPVQQDAGAASLVGG